MKQELSPDLIRVCQLMHEKNEWQNQRHYARKRALRLKEAMSYKTRSAKYRKMKRLAEMDVRKKMNEVPNWILGIHGTYAQISNELERRKGYAQGELAHMYKPDFTTSSKRMRSLTMTQLKCEWYKAHIADNEAKLAIALFTQTKGKELRKLMKKNGWKATMDNTNGRFVAIWHGNDQVVRGREGIAAVAAGKMLEDALVDDRTTQDFGIYGDSAREQEAGKKFEEWMK